MFCFSIFFLIPLHSEPKKSEKGIKQSKQNPFKLIKTIDDLFKKTEAKPPIYWTPKEVFLSQHDLIEATVTSIVNSIVDSIESREAAEHVDDEYNDLNYRYKNPTFRKLSHLIPVNSVASSLDCFDNGSLFLVSYDQEAHKLTCSTHDQTSHSFVQLKSIEIPVNRISPEDLNVSIHKFNNLIYLALNTDTGSLIHAIDEELTVKQEIKLTQHISRLLGVNDSFIYFKPEMENPKLESRIYVFDRKHETKKQFGQCNRFVLQFF